MTDEHATEQVRQRVDAIYRSESRRIFATLIRLLGDFDLAEDALHDAFRAAMEQWPREGVPANPRAWLVSTGRFKAIDQLRRRSRFETLLGPLAEEVTHGTSDAIEPDSAGLEDDQLRLIFTCCHPALALDARIALTLRTLGGLTTPEIARAFLVPEATMAQRIVRAKRTLAEARVGFEAPAADELAPRLASVLAEIR